MFFAVPVAERVRLKKELQQHYKTRSKLSHGEQVEILAEDLYKLDDLIRSFLFAMIDCRDRFRSKQDLLHFSKPSGLREYERTKEPIRPGQISATAVIRQLATTLHIYSDRNNAAGSMRIARSTGGIAASIAAASSVAMGIAIMRGSFGFT